MKRRNYNKLVLWKEKKQRLPLILRGARQTGKTFLIREFGKSFSQFHEFNFQKNSELQEIFRPHKDTKKILELLQIHSGKKIDLKNDLIFFDEIQDCPEALNSLKFFAEDYPLIYLIAAGSLLGIYLSSHSFPVGKVEFLNIYPLSFDEFLTARKKEDLVNLILKDPLSTDVNSFHQILKSELKLYFITGGMPRLVQEFIDSGDMMEVRKLQEDLLDTYKADFVKYSGPVDALKILSVFENIPKQLAKDNRKFQFKSLKSGGRYKEFSSAIDWLVNAGLVFKVPILSHAEIPLKALVDENIFKLYFFDIGLLGALVELPISVFSVEENIFKTFKGAFTENYFIQEFTAHREESLYCWQGKTAEVDFLFGREMEFFPVEVKSGESGKLKSLKVFSEKYHCKTKTRCSLFPLEIRAEGELRSIPLYLAGRV